MAVLINNGDVNWTGSFNVVTKNGEFYASSASSIVVNTTSIYSPTWSGDSAKTIIGGLFCLVNNGTVEQITFQLQEYTGGSWVDVPNCVSTYDVNSSSLGTSYSGEQNQNFIFAKFNSGGSVTETSGTNNYRFRVTGDSAGTSTSISYPSGYTSNAGCHRVYQNTQSLTNSDSLYIVGNKDGSTATVTVNTDDTSNKISGGLLICRRGILKFDNTSSNCGIKLSSYFIITNGGKLDIDATQNSTYKATLNLYDRLLCHHGSSLSIQGFPKFGATPTNFRTNLSSTANASQANLTCSLNVETAGWVAGDQITIQNTDPVNISRTEFKTIQSVSGSTITLTGNISYQHLSNAEICNVTRNVKILSQYDYAGSVISTWNSTYPYSWKYMGGVFDIDYAEFNMQVYSGGSIYNLLLNDTNVSNDYNPIFNVDNCSFYSTNTNNYSSNILNTYRTEHSNLVFYCSTKFGNAIKAIYYSNRYGTTKFNNCSIIKVKTLYSGVYTYTATPVYPPSIIELNNVNIYDASSNSDNAHCIWNDSIGTSLILNNCKLFGMGNTNSTHRSINTQYPLNLTINNSYLGSDGVNSMPNYTSVRMQGTSQVSINNSVLNDANKLIIANSELYQNVIPSNYPIYALNCSNYGMVEGRNISYQRYGTISDPITAGYSSAYNKSGAGSCVAITPYNATYPIYWTFQVPATKSVAEVVSFYITKTDTFNGTVKVTITDLTYGVILEQTADLTASIPINDGVGDDWSYQFSSGSITPTVSGNCTVEVRVTGTSGRIFIDEITVI